MQIEFCIESGEAAKAAEDYKVDRIEVCSDLAADGLSPGLELLKECRQIFSGDIYAMLRPRPGNFCYSSEELRLMQDKIYEFAEYGIDGLVFGLLDKANNIDIESCKLLMETAGELKLGVTFHRAFDVCNTPFSSLEEIVNLGFRRILTSGQKPSAFEGLDLLTGLALKARGRIGIMAGAGVAPQNALALCKSGVDALHFSVHDKGLSPASADYILKKKIDGILSQL